MFIVYPPGFPPRPYTSYHDEIVRWYDHWLKGIDTGILDEPSITLFVMEITGPLALCLEASIDKDDTNWMVDLVDVDPEGNRQMLTSGYLKAKFMDLDEEKPKPFQPVHPRKEPGPARHFGADSSQDKLNFA